MAHFQADVAKSIDYFVLCVILSFTKLFESRKITERLINKLHIKVVELTEGLGPDWLSEGRIRELLGE